MVSIMRWYLSIEDTLTRCKITVQWTDINLFIPMSVIFKCQTIISSKALSSPPSFSQKRIQHENCVRLIQPCFLLLLYTIEKKTKVSKWNDLISQEQRAISTIFLVTFEIYILTVRKINFIVFSFIFTLFRYFYVFIFFY